ncbi:hypothetical protein Aperf_G00000040623 [Anoplocephala perfoliata]
MQGAEVFNDMRVLHFKNFAYGLQCQEIEALLKRLGAINTQIYLSCSPAAKHRAFAEFRSTDDCWRIIRSLHQRELCGHRLVIEFGRYSHQNLGSLRSYSTGEMPTKKVNLPEWVQKLTSLSAKWLPGHSLPDALFSYPVATPAILTNIVRCLASVPAFYVQTLHLMNRLNLPAPFCDSNEFPGSLFVLTDEEINRSGIRKPYSSPLRVEVQEMDVSSGPESEISDGSSDGQSRSVSSNLKSPSLRKPPSKLKSGLLKLKQRRLDSRGKVLRPTSVAIVNVEEKRDSPKSVLPDESIFDKVPLRSTPHIEFRINDSTFGDVNENEMIPASQTAGFGVFSAGDSTAAELQSIRSKPLLPSSPTIAANTDGDEDDEFLKKPPPFLRDELYAGKACEAELASNPVFANSSGMGTPSSRLYVKNLHKKTTENDLWLVFGSFHRVYRRSQEELPNQFSIQLLTGGRMRGQAFIALDSIEVAMEALRATHGYVLNGRPMHVQFARGVIAKPDPNSLING